MLKKLILAALWLPLLALGQTYPSPTYQNVTVLGTLTAASQSFTNPLSVGSGGTGLSSISANALLYGNGTGALQTLGPLTNGQLVIGSTGAAPVAATLTGTTNQVNVATGAGSITLSLPQSIATTSSPTFAGLTLSTTPLGVSSGGSGLATRTAHAVQVGNGTSAITQVGPDATTGKPLVSQGSASDPAFSTSVTGLTFTSAITPQTTGGIVGTTAADNANAGSVGELISATGSNVSLSSGVGANVTSISLTAGDWDVWGSVQCNAAGSTVINSCFDGVSTTSAALPAVPLYAGLNGLSLGGGSQVQFPTPMQRINVSTTTTVYLVASSSFTTSTLTANGTIWARRRR
jgi:hypothetical protein